MVKVLFYWVYDFPFDLSFLLFYFVIVDLVDVFISTSRGSKKKLNRKIGGELLELNSAVVKKQMLPAERAYKYHLVQPTCMLS